MRKRIVTACILVMAACMITIYCKAKSNCTDAVSTAVSEQKQVKKVADAKSKKTLVIYFSVPETDDVDASSAASRMVSAGKVMGNTQYIATIIKEAVNGADIFEIKTVHSYPASHKALIDVAKEETDSKARPKLTNHIKNIKDYNVVFIGFPNWWYDMPMPLYTFFEEYDFSGKTIIPFCTHGGSRFSDAINTIRNLEKGATVIEGIAIPREQVARSKEEVLTWLKQIGMIE
ncbi:MAG: flavodoxin [Candidatus Aphodosoma sp.]